MSGQGGADRSYLARIPRAPAESTYFDSTYVGPVLSIHRRAQGLCAISFARMAVNAWARRTARAYPITVVSCAVPWTVGGGSLLQVSRDYSVGGC